MGNRKKNDETLTRSFMFETEGIRILDEETRTVELSFSSETPVARWGAEEVLSHKSGAVSLERLNTGGCLLFNHDRDRIIGKVISAKVKNRRGVATVQFDTDEDSETMFQKVKSGSLRNTSVGYRVLETRTDEKVKDGVKKVTYTATKWEPLEISLTPVPADITVGVGRSFGGAAKNTGLFEFQTKLNQNILNLNS